MFKYKIIPINGDYDYIGYFQDGLVFVRYNSDNRAGYIDKFGKIIIPLDYYWKFGDKTFVHYPFFYEGLAALINKDGKFGYVDKSNKTVIPFQYDLTYAFSEGLAAVKKDGKWGFIDKTNKVVIPMEEYDHVGTGMFDKGILEVNKNNKSIVIDKTGAVISFKFEYTDVKTDEKEKPTFTEDFDEVSAFCEGLAVVKKDDRYGYIDVTGKITIPIEYDFALSFSEGLAAARKNGKWEIIDLNI